MGSRPRETMVTDHLAGTLGNLSLNLAAGHYHVRVMAISIVQLGTPRKQGEGLRLGAVRHPPRGVRKNDLARHDYYDTWFPNLAPGAELLKAARASRDDRSWSVFQRKYRREMSHPDRSRILDVLAALSHQTSFSVGCYCADETRCHRSVLRELLLERGADVVQGKGPADKES